MVSCLKGSFVFLGAVYLFLVPGKAWGQCYDFETVPNTNIPLKWPSSSIPVHYVVNYLGTSDVSNASYTDGEFGAIHQALRTWSQVNSSSFWCVDDGIVSQTATQGIDNLNLIIWRDSIWPSDYDSSAIAVTTTWFESSSGRIVNADMELNGVNFTWRIVTPSCNPNVDRNVVDVQNIVTHEGGHMLGLDHPPADTACQDAAMYYASTACEMKKRNLSLDDMAGLSILYPASLITITSVSPSTALNNTWTAITISGSGFDQDAAVTLTQAHRPNITPVVTFTSSTTLTCTVSLTGASVGPWTVWVTNPDGKQGKLFEGFTVAGGGMIFTPVANAGVSNSVIVGTKVVLDGSKSYDPDGTQPSYSWSIASAPEQVALSDANSAYPSFTPQKPGGYVATLVVSNGTYPSQPSSVTITVTSAPSSSGSGNGCGCTLALEGSLKERGGTIPEGIVFLGLAVLYVWVKRRRSRRTRQPGRSPR